MVGAIDGGTIWWVGPTFTITSIIWRQLKKATRGAWINKSEVEKRIELPGGGSITVHSADNPDSLRGEGLDGLVVDEAAFVSEETWAQSLRPSLADRHGWCMMISTPNGPNWFGKLFASVATRVGWERWQRPTADNPLISPEELEEARLDIGPRAFAQEHEAQFLDIEGAEFPGEYFQESIWFDEWPDNLALKVLSLDPSKGKTDRSDYSAYVLLGLDQDGTLWVDCDMARRDTATIVRDGIRLCDWWNPHSFAVEANQFQELLIGNFAQASGASGMRLSIHPVVNTLNKITRIRAALTPYLSRRELRIRKTRGGRMLVDQIQQFPEGKHDDGPDALAMAIEEMKRLFYSQGTARFEPALIA